MVFYQIFPTSYQEGKLFKTITSNKKYYEDLGVDALLFCPIFLSPRQDAGYDVEDYYKLDPLFGELEDFKLMISELKQSGIEVYLDIAFNHTSSSHPWFKKAITLDEKYKDYYIIKEGIDNREPNLWTSNRTYDSVWKKIDGTNHYYFHIYDDFQPDLNWENPKVIREVSNVINYWYDMGVTGFRLDVINKIGKDFSNDQSLSDYTVSNDKFQNVDITFDYIKQLRSQVPSDITFIGQVEGADKALLTRYNDSGIDKTLIFNHLKLNKGPMFERIDKDFKDILNVMDEVSSHHSNMMFLENHDSPRSINTFLDGVDVVTAARMLASILFSFDNDIIIYQGQEQGMLNPGFKSINELNDVRSITYYNKRIEKGEDEATVLSDILHFTRDNSRAEFKYKQNGIYIFYSQLIKCNR